MHFQGFENKMPHVPTCISISDTFVMISENNWNIDKESNVLYDYDS